MRRLMFTVMIALLLGALLFQGIASTPSYLLVVVGNTSIEMSLWLALGIFLSVALTIGVTLGITRKGLRATWGQFKRLFSGSSARAQRQTSRGLIEFVEGNWKQAHKLLTRAAPHASEPLLNYLAAARSAYELGEESQAAELLHQAEGSADNADLAVALTQARMQLFAKKYEQCCATLQRARKLAPKHPVVLDLLRQVHVALNDWSELAQLMPMLVRYKIVPSEELQVLQAQLYRQLLIQAMQPPVGSSSRDDSPAKQETRIKQVWQKLAKEWQQQADLILCYADLLEELGNTRDLESLLRKALKKNWDNRLVERYGIIDGSEHARQLLHAEAWLKERPGNAELLLALGRLSLRNELWGKARDYFQSSLALQGSAHIYAELARLLAHMGDHKKSTEYFQQGLMLAADDLPKLPMPQEHTAAS